MNYTLYIDEAGPFETSDGVALDLPWLVGGILVPSTLEQAELSLGVGLSRSLETLSAAPWFREFREFLQDAAQNPLKLDSFYAKHILDTAKAFADPRLLHRVSVRKAMDYYRQCRGKDVFPHMEFVDETVLSAIPSGSRKVIAIHGRKPIVPDSVNYAILIQDVLLSVLAEVGTEIPAKKQCAIEFLVAQRLFEDRQNKMHKLDKHFIANAIACGMAAIDMLSAIEDSHRPVRLVRHGEFHGSVAADFVCARARDAASLQGIGQVASLFGDQGIIHAFTSATPVQRRSRISEVRGDFGDALAWQLKSKSVNISEVNRLVSAMLKMCTAVQVRHGTEKVIDELDRWSKKASRQQVVKSLGAFLDALETAIAAVEEAPPEFHASTFRIASYLSIWANQLGDSELARSLEVKLERARAKASTDAFVQEAIYQREIALVEQAINDHRFVDAELASQRHAANVATIAGISPRTSTPSHCQIRAESLELRSSALAAVSQSNEEKLRIAFELVEELSTRLRRALQSGIAGLQDHVVRVFQIEAYCAESLTELKVLERVQSDLASLLDNCEAEYPYALALYLRVSSSLAMLSPEEKNKAHPRSIIAHARTICEQRDYEHPRELIAREWALLAFAREGRSSQDSQRAVGALTSWLQASRPKSEVLRHQAKLGRAVTNYIDAGKGPMDLSEAQELRARVFVGRGVDERTARLLALRSETIY